jgi:C4-dicarboxylate-specific signal transduction histidine kinase
MTDSIQEAEVRSFGEIAGEIGHELNNQLGIISGRAELARMHLDRGRVDDARAGFDIILRQIDRMRLLSERLRGMRVPPQPLHPHDPREIIARAIEESPLRGSESAAASLDSVPTVWMNVSSIRELFAMLHSHLGAIKPGESRRVISRVELRYATGSRSVALVITFSGMPMELGRQLLAEAARILATTGVGIRVDFPENDLVFQVELPLATPAPHS